MPLTSPVSTSESLERASAIPLKSGWTCCQVLQVYALERFMVRMNSEVTTKQVSVKPFTSVNDS